MVIARVEALIAGVGMKEAIHRATAYEKAGADAIIIHSKEKTPNEIFDFTDNWTGTIPSGPPKIRLFSESPYHVPKTNYYRDSYSKSTKKSI